MKEGLVRKRRLLSVLQKSVINTSWFFRGKKKSMSHTLCSMKRRDPMLWILCYPSPILCCRNFVLKGSEVWRSSSTPWRALVIWETGLIEERIPTSVVLLGPQTQMCEWTHSLRCVSGRIPTITPLPPLDFSFAVHVWLPLPPSQAGSGPLNHLCCLISLHLSSLGACGLFALNYNDLRSPHSDTS